MAVTRSVTYEGGYNPSEEKKKELEQLASERLSKYETTSPTNYQPVKEELYQAVQKGEDTLPIAQQVKEVPKTTQEVVKEQHPDLLLTTEEQRKKLIEDYKKTQATNVLGRNETISQGTGQKQTAKTNLLDILNVGNIIGKNSFDYLNKAWGNVVNYWQGNDNSIRNQIISNEGDRQTYWRKERLLNNYANIVSQQPDILNKEAYTVPKSLVGRLEAGTKAIAPTIISSILPQAVSSASQFIGDKVGNNNITRWGEKFGVQTSLNFAKSKAGQVVANSKSYADGGWSDPIYYTNAVANTVGSFGTIVGGSILGTLITGNPAVGTALGYSLGFTQEASQMYIDLLERGFRKDQALDASTLYGMASTALENMIGLKPAEAGKNFLKQGLKETVIEMTSKPLYQSIKQGLKESAKTGLEEGLEESLQQLTQNAISKVLDNNQNLTEGLLDSFVMGGVGGMVLSGANQIQQRTSQFVRNNQILRNTNTVGSEQLTDAVKQYQTANAENKIKIKPTISAGVASLFQPLVNINTPTTQLQASIIPLTDGYTYLVKGNSSNLIINDSGIENNITFKTRDEAVNFVSNKLSQIANNPIVSGTDAKAIEANNNYQNIVKLGKSYNTNVIQRAYSSATKMLDSISMKNNVKDVLNKYYSALDTFDNYINKGYTEYQYQQPKEQKLGKQQVNIKIGESVKEARQSFDKKIVSVLSRLSDEAVLYAKEKGKKYTPEQVKKFKSTFIELLSNRSNYVANKDQRVTDVVDRMMEYPDEYYNTIGSNEFTKEKEKVKKKIALNLSGIDDPFNPLSQKDQMLYELLQELTNAEAGQRIVSQDEYGDKKIIGQKSTYPKWISEELRNKDLFDRVMKQINTGTVPTNEREIKLYNEISDTIDDIEQSFKEITDEYYKDTGEVLDLNSLDESINAEYLINKEKEANENYINESKKSVPESENITEDTESLEEKIKKQLLERRDNKEMYRITDGEDPLYAEARKYKTADEFVKVQGGKGYITVYHRTNAPLETFGKGGIYSKENRGEFFVSNKKNGQAEGYGKNIVELRVKKSDLEINDEFPSGEEHYTLPVKKADEYLKTKSQLTNIWNKVNSEKFRTGDIIERKTGIKLSNEERKEIEQLNMQIFGDTNVNYLERLLTPSGQKALGSYRDNIIRIVDGEANAKDTFYHEAVHKAMDTLSDIDERTGILAEVMRGNNITDIDEAEEVLAENFIDYAKSREGFVGKIKMFFDRLIERIKKLFSRGNEKKVTELYDKIISGKLKETKQRGFAKSVQTKEQATNIVKRNANTKYGVLHNKDTIEQGNEIINKDLEKAIERAKYGKSTAVNNYIAEQLIVDLQNTRVGDSLDILESLSKRATESGQASQILSLWGKLTPQGITRYAQRIINKANINLKLTGDKKIKLTGEQLKTLTGMAEEIQTMPEGQNKKIKIAKMLDYVHSLIPVSMTEKLSYIQTLAQLLNPKTFIRNILGNLGFQQLENITDMVGVPIDLATSIFTKKRSQYFPDIKSGFKGMKLGLAEGIKESQEGVNTLGDISQFEIKNKRVLKSNIGQYLDKILRLELQAPDRAFYQSAFNKELSNQLKANNTDTPTSEMIAIAHQEGLRQTFQDNNRLSKMFIELKRTLNRVPFLGELLLKYPKTPANILMRAIEYTPVSFFDSLQEIANATHGDFNQRRFVNGMSRAITGSVGLVGLGYMLASLGIITGGPEDDKDMKAVQSIMGIGKYKINASALFRFLSTFDVNSTKLQSGDKLYSYDWLQPMAIAVGIGANMKLSKDKSGMSFLETFLSSLESGANTLAEQPIISGLTNFVSYGKSPVESFLDTMIMAPSSFVPTAIRQVKDLTTNYYKETEQKLGFKKMYDSFLTKFPYIEQYAPLRYNVFGQPMEKYQGDSNSIFNVFFNPGFVSTFKEDKVGQEILRLYEETGSKTQAPRVVDRKIGGQELTTEQISKYQEYFGKRTYEEYNKLISGKKVDKKGNKINYEKMSDEDKIKTMQNIMTDINKEAKTKILGM